jgi:hypothetical protein
MVGDSTYIQEGGTHISVKDNLRSGYFLILPNVEFHLSPIAYHSQRSTLLSPQRNSGKQVVCVIRIVEKSHQLISSLHIIDL